MEQSKTPKHFFMYDKEKHPKLFRALFNLTAHDKKIPTDENLDYEIEQLGFYMRYAWPLLSKIIKRKIFLFWRYKWKIWAKNIIVYSLLLIAIYFAWIKVAKPIFIKETPNTIIKEIYVTNLKSFDELMVDVGERESSNRWKAHKDGSSMLGYFQFDPTTLKLIGINVEPEYFLNDSNLQISAFKRLMHVNRITYQKYINRWNNKPLPQDKRYIITESGILMAFHLKPAGTIQYFNSGCVDDSNCDGNGTKVSDYIKEFSGYKVEY